MRILYPTGTRQERLDRNPVSKTVAAALGPTGPHGNTNRGSYTCPAGKRAVIGFCSVDVERVTVAAPVGVVTCQLNASLIATTAPLMEIVTQNNVAGQKYSMSGYSGIVLRATEVINLQTADGSTGGTVRYDLIMSVTEYDA